MFGKSFKKDPAPAKTAPPAAAVSANEASAWQDRIAGAVGDDAALLELARGAPEVNLKLAAIKALTREESFRQAMHDFREHDKRLYRAAKSRWQAAHSTRTTAAEARALIEAARALLEQPSLPANRVVELDRAWEALDAKWLEAPLSAEFAGLSAQLRDQVRTRGKRAQTVARWLAAVDESMGRLNATLHGVAQGDTDPAEPEALAVGLLELAQSAPDLGDERCATRTEAAHRLLAIASSVVERAKLLRALPATGGGEELAEKRMIERWRALPEMSEGELHTLLATRFAEWRNAAANERQRKHEAQSTRDRERRAREDDQRRGALLREVEAAEAALAAGHIADVTRHLNGIDGVLKHGPASGALARRIEALRREHRRLEDWRRWGGRQGREQLVAEAQALAGAGTVSVTRHADAIAGLRERWKALDKLGGASNQGLWLAFDSALKAAYAPVAAHLDKLRLAREENLAARETIVQGLLQAAEKYFPVAPAPAVAQPDPSGSLAPLPNQEGEGQYGAGATATTDWRAVSRALDEARVAWRKLGPVEHTVPRKALKGGTAITARYVAASQALEVPLRGAHDDARRRRRELIAAAKDLAGSDVAARDVVNKVRRLQTQWQSVARSLPLPRRDENALWTEFKAATDSIFSARDAARSAAEAEIGAKLRARIDIIERVAALSSANGAQDIKRVLSEADSAWRGAPAVPKPQASKMDARYRAAREAAQQRLGELAVRASQARYDALIAKMALCQEREAAGDSLSDEQVTELEARWNAIEQFPEAWKAKLDARFRSSTAATHAAAPVARQGRKGGESLPDILLSLELACDLDSPPECAAERQRRKMLALKVAMEDRQSILATPADIERWLLDAAAFPRPDEQSRERLGKIISAVRKRRANG